MNRILRATATSLLLAFAAAPALAHSTVKSTTPTSGSILPASPPEVVIVFNEAARLTSAVIAAAGKPERRAAYSQSGSSTTFTIADPQLGAGRNEIKWKALSKDGHPIEGSVIIVVRPGAVPIAPALASDHHNH